MKKQNSAEVSQLELFSNCFWKGFFDIEKQARQVELHKLKTGKWKAILSPVVQKRKDLRSCNSKYLLHFHPFQYLDNEKNGNFR